jgi:hypothetical protein
MFVPSTVMEIAFIDGSLSCELAAARACPFRTAFGCLVDARSAMRVRGILVLDPCTLVGDENAVKRVKGIEQRLFVVFAPPEASRDRWRGRRTRQDGVSDLDALYSRCGAAATICGKRRDQLLGLC